MTALPLQSKITASNQGKTTFKILEARYGNGYSQRAKDGLNNARATWELTWSGINKTELQTIQTAFDDAAGVDVFVWTPFGESLPKKWSIAEWSKAYTDDGFINVYATLNQEYDI